MCDLSALFYTNQSIQKINTDVVIICAQSCYTYFTKLSYYCMYNSVVRIFKHYSPLAGAVAEITTTVPLIYVAVGGLIVLLLLIMVAAIVPGICVRLCIKHKKRRAYSYNGAWGYCIFCI